MNLDLSTKLVVLERAEKQLRAMPIAHDKEPRHYIRSVLQGEQARIRAQAQPKPNDVLAWHYGTSHFTLNGRPVDFGRNTKGMLAVFTVLHLGYMPWDILFSSRVAALNAVRKYAADAAERFSENLKKSILSIGTTGADLVLRGPVHVKTRIEGAAYVQPTGTTLLGSL